MGIRYLKIVLVMFLSLLCLIYGLQNLANLDACFGAVSYVLGMSEHTYYANSWFPAVTNSSLVWICVFIIILAELTAGILLLIGAFTMFKARQSDSATFNQAKSLSLIGAGIGIIVWFGFFGVLGGAWFQMWQTSVGAQSLGGAFQYFASCVFIWLIVRSDD
ncbi:DUF2165 family protein [Kangiella marina]|uniref:DUF2165 domain-containing protein n=1 Tax=Kangiella marina TaxID=1079178 RepID=A0ABP8IKN1_9GAMM